MSKGLAKAVITKMNKIEGLNLYINDKYYGHYPLDLNFNGAQQLKDAINDAIDYGYEGIKLVNEV